MLAHALTFSRSPPGGTVSRRLEGLGMIDTEVADALDPRTDGTLAGLDDLGDFAGEGGAPRGGGPRPRSRSPGIATSESDGEVSLLSRGDSAPMLGLAALVLLKAKAKKMANRARKRVKAKKKVSIQDGKRGRKRKGDRNSSSRDRASRPGSRGRRGDRAPSAERADRSESPPEPWGEEHGAAARAKRARSPPAADGPRDAGRDARLTRESGGGFESLGGGEPRPDNASWVLSDDLSYSSASHGARPTTPPAVVAIPYLDAPLERPKTRNGGERPRPAVTIPTGGSTTDDSRSWGSRKAMVEAPGPAREPAPRSPPKSPPRGKLKGLGDGPKGDASSEDETENDEGSFPLHVLTDDESAAERAKLANRARKGHGGIFVKGETALAGADPPRALPDDKRVDRSSAGEALLPAFHGPRVSLPGGNVEDAIVVSPRSAAAAPHGAGRRRRGGQREPALRGGAPRPRRVARAARGRTRERNSQLQRLISRPFSTRFG